MSLKSWVLGTGYRTLVKPIFFQFDPEFIHEHHVSTGEWLGQFSAGRFFVRQLFEYSSPKLGKTIDGIYFPNPIGLAAGFDYNGQLTGILPSVGFGFQTIGTVTMKAHAGNAAPRLTRFPKSQSILVNKGLKNWGAKRIIKHILEKDGPFETPVGVSVGASVKAYANVTDQIRDVIECFRTFERSLLKHSYYELNISCPNITGGESFVTATRLNSLLKAIDRLALERPLYLKMPISVSNDQFLSLIKVATQHNVQGFVIGNLQKDKQSPDVEESERQRWLKLPGNLSGKPTFHRSNELIALARKQVKHSYTIIGLGGVFTAEDALVKMEMGADLVQLITGLIYQGPQMVGEICEQLAERK